MILEAERKMWAKHTTPRPPVLTDAQIEAKYDTKSERIVTETNREKLPNFYDSLKKQDYMNTRPFYQRRSRWNAKKQSRLIESILINIPIPPLFVYETKSNVHEVMDGQQRITAIQAFYSNTLVLDGLERWPELNGRTYAKLPKAIRDGIDRRSISWISVLRESSENEEESVLLNQLVFERLNTGGVELSHQEIRNALYAGPFNDALLELSREAAHRQAWGLPEFSESEIEGSPEYLEGISFYEKMEDVEVILRFFALRNADFYQRGMREFLDLYMLRARNFTSTDIAKLKELYERVIALALAIYGDHVFRAYDVQAAAWGTRRQKAFADAVLVGLANNLDRAATLLTHSTRVVEATANLFITSEKGALTGRGNTKKDVQSRIELMTGMLRAIG
jgi:hypothetical protein